MVGPEMEHIGGDGEKSGKEKLPYNLRERKIKHASYREIIRAGLADELYDGILKIVVEEKKYKDCRLFGQRAGKGSAYESALSVGCHQFTLRQELFMSGE